MHPNPASLVAYVAALRAANPSRVHPFDFAGSAYWLKQQDVPQPALAGWLGSLLVRLTRNPLYAPASTRGPLAIPEEVQRLRQLADKGMPVPEVVATGGNWFVLPDLGKSLRQILEQGDTDSAMRHRFLVAAGETLGTIHTQGLWHGKATVRDMIWDGERIWFVDFEENPARFFPPLACQVRDLMFFVYSLFRFLQPMDPLLGETLRAYRSKAPTAVWAGACAQAKAMPVVHYCCGLLAWLRIRDLVQTRHMLRLFRRANPEE